MTRTENEAKWHLRFIDRTHDTELYKLGHEADPELSDKIFSREYFKHKDYKRAEETARINVIWRGFEIKSNSPMLAEYR